MSNDESSYNTNSNKQINVNSKRNNETINLTNINEKNEYSENEEESENSNESENNSNYESQSYYSTQKNEQTINTNFNNNNKEIISNEYSSEKSSETKSKNNTQSEKYTETNKNYTTSNYINKDSNYNNNTETNKNYITSDYNNNTETNKNYTSPEYNNNRETNKNYSTSNYNNNTETNKNYITSDYNNNTVTNENYTTSNYINIDSNYHINIETNKNDFTSEYNNNTETNKNFTTSNYINIDPNYNINIETNKNSFLNYNNHNESQTLNNNDTTTNNQNFTQTDKNEKITYIDKYDKTQTNNIIENTSNKNTLNNNNEENITNNNKNLTSQIATYENNYLSNNSINEFDENYKNEEYYINSKKIYKQMSIELMKIIINSKLDKNVFLRKNDYINILNILQKSTTEYYYIHNLLPNELDEEINKKTIENNNDNIINNFRNIDFLLYKPLLYNINYNAHFEFILYKNRNYSNSLIKRFGIIMNNKFYSSNVALDKFDEKNEKEKTDLLKESIIVLEKRNNEEWSEKNLPYRINITYKENNKSKHFYLYSNDKIKIKNCFGLLEKIKIELNKDKINYEELNKKIENNMINSIKNYFIMKMILVKRKVKNRILIKNYINKEIKNDKKIFKNFLSEFKEKIIKFNEKQNKYLFFNDKKYIISTNYIKKNNRRLNINYSFLKKSVELIINFMKRKREKNKNLSLNVLINNKEETLIFDYKNNIINSISKNFQISSNEIFNISNIIYNISKENNLLENGLLILGEKINNFKILNFKYKDNKEIFYEYENEKRNYNLKGHLIQIFHCKINVLEIQEINIFDSYFYIEIKSNNKTTFKSNIIQSVNLNSNYLKLEFNIEFYLKETLMNDLIELKLHLIPKENYNEKYDDIILDYISKKELSSIKIDLSKNEIEYILSPLNNSTIILNTIPLLETKDYLNICNVNNKYLTIGNDFYLISNLTTNLLRNLKENKIIPPFFKHKYYDIHFDEEKEKFYNKLNPNINIFNESDLFNNNKKLINGIIHNSKFSFINQISLDSNNKLNLYSDELNVKFLCQFKGKNKKNEILFYNYFTNQIYCKKINESNIISLNQNIFNVIDLKLIYNNSINYIDNYKCKKFIQFKNKTQLSLFIQCLKKLKRQINFKYQFLNNKKNKIERNLLYNILSNESCSNLNQSKLKDNLKNLKEVNLNYNNFSSKKYIKILFEKVEFKQNYTIDYDYFFNLNIYKQKKSLNNKENLVNYLLDNSLIKNNESLIESLKEENQEINFKTLKNTYFVSKDLFNKGKKNIILQKKEIIVFEMNILNKKLYINLLLITKDKKYTIENYSEINLTNLIEETNKKLTFPISEFFIIPIFSGKDDKKVLGFIDLKLILSLNDNPKKFNEEYNTTIKNYFLENKNKLKNFKLIGTFEPNILRRLNMKIIYSNFKNSLDKNKLNNFLKDNGLHYNNFIPEIYNKDDNSYLLNKVSNYIINNKKNNFYSFQTICEWNLLFNKFIKEKKNDINLKEIFLSFPSSEILISLLNSGHYIFNEIRNLFYFGLPNIEIRKIIWNKILSIDKLYEMTILKILKYKNLINNKGDLYNFFNNISNNYNNKNNNISLIDTFIDNDIIYLKSENIKIIKNITKNFFNWSSLKINLYNDNINYIYFTGILSLVHRLFNIINSPSETFFIIIGLSQIVKIFNQNFLIKDYEEYILIIKLLLEKYHLKIYNKLVSLNFPFEIFILKNFSSFYTDFFHSDELFMKFLDIFIFESFILKNSKNDKNHYLRLLVTIPLTILSLNEKYILEVKNVYQLEKVLKCIKYKNYNEQFLIQTINDNINKYFYLESSVFYYWFNLTNKNNDNSIWDNKRNEILKLYNENYYSLIKKEYETFFFGKFNNIFLQNNKRINIEKWKQIIFQNLNHKDNNINDLNNGILFIVKKVFLINNDKNIHYINNKKISSYVNKNKIIFGNIIINENGYVLFLDSEKNIFNVKYLNNSKKEKLYIKIGNEEKEIFKFKINLQNIDLLNPINLQIPSKNIIGENLICIIEIVLLKYSLEIINDEISDLNLFFFSNPNFEIDNIMKDKLYQLNNIEKIKDNKINFQSQNPIFTLLNNITFKLPRLYIYYIKRNIFSYSSNYRINNKNLIIKLQAILTQLFNIENNVGLEFAKKIIFWYFNSNNNISFLEILFSIIIEHCPNNLNINDILYNLFSICSLENKHHTIKLSNAINFIYSLYKKFCLNFTYYDVSYMVNYYFKKEKYSSIKNVIVFNRKNLNEIKNYLYDNEYIKTNLENKINLYQDITNEFCFNLNNLYSVYKEVEKIKNIKNKNFPFNLNRNSLDNILFILNYIYIKNGFSNENFDIILIEYNKEFSNEEFYFKINKQKKEISFDDINSIYSSNFNYKFNNELNIYKSILYYSFSNLLFINTNNNYINTNINFDDFKKLIFNLPYLSDLIYKNCFLSFYTQRSNISINKYFSNKIIFFNIVKVYIINNSENLITFTFSNNNIISNKTDNNYLIEYIFNSCDSIKDIYEMIINKLLYQTLNIANSEKIKQSLYKLNLIEISIKIKGNFIKTNYNTSLYMLIDNEDIIEINFDITNIYNKIDKEIEFRGYSKFYLNNEKNYYEWRICNIINVFENNLLFTQFDSLNSNLLTTIQNKEEDIIKNREEDYI